MISAGTINKSKTCQMRILHNPGGGYPRLNIMIIIGPKQEETFTTILQSMCFQNPAKPIGNSHCGVSTLNFIQKDTSL